MKWVWLRNRHKSILEKVAEELGEDVDTCAKVVAGYTTTISKMMGEIVLEDPTSFRIFGFPMLFTLVPIMAKITGHELVKSLDIDHELLESNYEKHRGVMIDITSEKRKKLQARPNNIFNKIREKARK